MTPFILIERKSEIRFAGVWKYFYYTTMAWLNQLIIVLSFCNILSTNEPQLKKMNNGKYFIPGKSCGVLTPIKFLNYIPENIDEIHQCSIIDMSSR